MKNSYVMPSFILYNRPFWRCFSDFEKSGVPEFTANNVKELKKQFRCVSKDFGILINWQKITESGSIQLLEKKELAPPHILEKYKFFYEKYESLRKQAVRWQKDNKNEND